MRTLIMIKEDVIDGKYDLTTVKGIRLFEIDIEEQMDAFETLEDEVDTLDYALSNAKSEISLLEDENDELRNALQYISNIVESDGDAYDKVPEIGNILMEYFDVINSNKKF